MLLARNDDIYCGFLRWSYCFGHWSYWFHGQSIVREVAAFLPDNNKNLHTNSTKKRIFRGNEINTVAGVKGKVVYSLYFRFFVSAYCNKFSTIFGVIRVLVFI